MTYWRDDSCDHRRRFIVWPEGHVLVICRTCGQVESGQDGKRAILRYATVAYIRRVADYL